MYRQSTIDTPSKFRVKVLSPPARCRSTQFVVGEKRVDIGSVVENLLSRDLK